ncbi:MAG: flagellar motor protein MotB [Armatimonadota bacterium]
MKTEEPKEVNEIRIIKKANKHGGHHGGAWKVAYADFVTAMMAFFLVMWIVGLSQEIKTNVAEYFKDPIGFMEAVRSGRSPIQTPVPGDPKYTEVRVVQDSDVKRIEQVKHTIETMIANSPEFASLKDYIKIKIDPEGLKIDLLEAKESLFFDSASAKIKPKTRALLAKVSQEIGKLPNKVIIEGHTDSRPLARRDGYTNWELSTDRANAARRIMEQNGLENK